MSFLKNKFNKYHFLLGVIIIALVFAASAVYKTKKVAAVGLLPFGGRSTELFSCSCSGNWAITIVGAKPGIFSYEPGTPTFSAYQIRPGVWMMGTYVPGGKGCLTGVPPACVAARTPIGTMTQVGTSLAL